MRNFALILLALSALTFSTCDDDEDPGPNETLGTMELEFENVMGPQDNQGNFALSAVGSTEYNYENNAGQDYNITLLKYYISEIVLTGSDGVTYSEPMSVSATESNGYHLVDASDPSSFTFDLRDVPPGRYNKVSFLLGVDSTGVLEGAAGDALDPSTSGMFWTWNAGYVAVKVEGQSPASPGGARGNTINPENTNGFVYHIGGWKNISGTPFVYNNKRIEIDFDEFARVRAGLQPTVHFELDVASLLDGPGTEVDFATDQVNVHRPVDSAPLAQNASAAFRFDHIHQ